MIDSQLFERVEDYFKQKFVENYSFERRLGAKPLPITDAERAKMLETHCSYFANMLFDFMKQKNLSEVDVAAKAHADVAVFSRLRDDKRFVPKERTVWALVLALELNLDDANTLMHRLKYYLDAKVREEVLLAFCLENRVFDLDLVNKIFAKYALEPIEVHEDFLTPVQKFRDENFTAQLDLYLEQNFREMPTNTGGVKFSISAHSLGEPAESEKTFDVIIRGLKDKLGLAGSLFSDYLFKLIKRKNLTEVEVYKRAHLDRRVFSKIRNERNYMPAKKTVLAIAFAMKLDFKETNTLLARAGYFLSSARKEDVIAAYFVENQIHDMFLLNEVLDYYNCPTLGD